MKKLLFIIPSMSYAGTNSALSSIYNAINDKYEIMVLPINMYGEGIYAFREAVVTSDLLTAWDVDFSRLNWKQKCMAVLVKPLKHLNSKLADKLNENMFRLVARRIYRKFKYDVVIGFQDGTATRVAAGFPCKNKIAWSHCDYNHAFAESINELSLYQQFDKIVAVSEFTRSTFVKRYPSLDNKTIAIHNLLDVERIKNMSKESIHDDLFVKRGYTIISVGRIAKVKHFDCIPEIASRLVNMGLDFRWFIIGEGDLKEKKIIEENIHKFMVEDNVTLLGLKTNPYPYFLEADLLASTSFSEACPMIFKEAKILKLPIISSDFGSAKEFVFDGKNGFVSSIQQFPNVIFSIFSDKVMYETLKNHIGLSDNDNNHIINQIENIL